MTRWSVERAADWQQSAGWLLGCNFAPSTAGNQLELWQEASFDASTIDRELGWAGELGMNVVRVYLHDLVYQADGDRYLDRIDAFLHLFSAVRHVERVGDHATNIAEDVVYLVEGHIIRHAGKLDRKESAPS